MFLLPGCGLRQQPEQLVMYLPNIGVFELVFGSFLSVGHTRFIISKDSIFWGILSMISEFGVKNIKSHCKLTLYRQFSNYA